MPVYPVNTNIRPLIERFGNNGSFSLWFSKFIPFNNERDWKPSDGSGNEKERQKYYQEQYQRMRASNSVRKNLECMHQMLDEFAMNLVHQSTVPVGYLIIRAELRTPMLIGVGLQHPSENGFLFHHKLGVPYIPASSLKGLMRFAWELQLIDEWDEVESLPVRKLNGVEVLDEEDDKTGMPYLFGRGGSINREALRGHLIFLDGLPLDPPDLKRDITTVHFKGYYGSKGEIPPVENEEPNPVSFLAVREGSIFVFRCIVPEEGNWKEQIRKVFEKALKEEGVGAKKSLGYGLFGNLDFQYAGKDKKTATMQAETGMGEEKDKPGTKPDDADDSGRLDILEKLAGTNDPEMVKLIFRMWEMMPELHQDKEIIEAFRQKLPKKTRKGKITEEYRSFARITGEQLPE